MSACTMLIIYLGEIVRRDMTLAVDSRWIDELDKEISK